MTDNHVTCIVIDEQKSFDNLLSDTSKKAVIDDLMTILEATYEAMYHEKHLLAYTLNVDEVANRAKKVQSFVEQINFYESLLEKLKN